MFFNIYIYILEMQDKKKNRYLVKEQLIKKINGVTYKISRLIRNHLKRKKSSLK